MNRYPLWKYLFILLVLVAGNRLQIRTPNFYLPFGVLLWIALLKSGVHATVAGVLLGMTIPLRPRLGHGEFLAEHLLDRPQSAADRRHGQDHQQRQGQAHRTEKVQQALHRRSMGLN